jgi:hypothetical protein
MKRNQRVSREKLCFSLLVAVLVMSGCSAENSSSPNAMNTPMGQSAGFSSQQAGSGGSQIVPVPISGQAGPQPFEWDERESDENSPDSCATFSATAKRWEVQVPKEVPVEVPVEVVEEVVEEVVTEVKEALPISIYIMLDISLSMLIPDATLLPKSVTAVDAITTFVNDPNSAGISVAFGAFPYGSMGCDGAAYANPVVPMGVLPDNAGAIAAGVALALPLYNSTPTEPALIGATRYCAQYKRDPVANPDGNDCAVIFITDGLPADCNTNSTYLAGIARDAYNNHGVTTFAVGMFGADFFMLNELAEAGQGPHDCHPDDPNLYACAVDNPNMNLLQALELIRDYITTYETTYETTYVTTYVTRTEIEIQYETVVETETLDCEWQIPPPPEGEVFDKNKANVELSMTGRPEDGRIIPMAANEAACGNELAWYYDNPDNPTRIIACPQTCNVIKSAELGTIDIVLGCEVVLIE